MTTPSSSDDKENQKPRQTLDDKKIAAALDARRHKSHLGDLKKFLARSSTRYKMKICPNGKRLRLFDTLTKLKLFAVP
jgi:hypothetical protein